jgi:hypothetical protein
MKWLAALFAGAAMAAGCTCSASHVSDVGSDALVAIDGRGGDDGSIDADAAAECDPEVPSLAKLECDAEYVAACAEWARQVWSGPGYVHTHCEEVDGIAYCTVGNYCDRSGDHFPPPICQCQRSLTCNSEEVCVSDTPDGPPRCVPRCS